MTGAERNGGMTKTQLGEYGIEGELTPGSSYRAIDTTGRAVVLKLLDSECLWHGQLHPLIKDRMARVKELPNLKVAFLQGAGREDGRVFLVWEYVQGTTLREYAVGRSRREIVHVAKEIVGAAEALHGLGIVHGALHARNIIVMADGGVKLTHVSPLLYDDPETDVIGVIEMLEELGLELAMPADGKRSLREIGAKLDMIGPDGTMAVASGGGSEAGENERQAERRLRRSGIILALLAAAGGAVVAWTIWWMAWRT